MIIKAKIGNKFRKAGIHWVNSLSKAPITANGLTKAQSTSMIQMISSRMGRKNLYNIKNGMNWSSSFMIASKMSLPKFKLNCGINGPEGTNSCIKSKIHSKSSGNPIGKSKEGTGKEKANPGGPGAGTGKDTDPQDEAAPRERPALADGAPGSPIPSPIENGGIQGIAGEQGITGLYILLVV
jgi:hypothetical protein